MTWAYLSTAPASSDKSWIRLRIGDTSSGDQLLQDEEIEGLLSGTNKYEAAALCAESVGARFARRADKSVGKLSIAQGRVAESYFRLAKRLRSEMNMRVAPYAGGISVSDKNDVEADTNRVTPGFSIGQFDLSGAATSGI